MDLLFARILEGLSDGAIYAFLGLALVCVFRGTGTLNLAQGEMAMFCAYIAYSFVQHGIPVLAAILLVTCVGFIGGGLIERVLIRPLGRNSGNPALLVTIGIFLALNAGAGVIWGGQPLPFPNVVPSGPANYISLFGYRLHYQELLILCVLLAILGLLSLLFRFTRLGLAMRAAASNPDSALLLGIRVNRINGLGWMLAAAIGAALGPLVAPSTTLTPDMMQNFIIYAVAAATVGGFDSPGGTVLAGLLLGVIEVLVASYVSVIGISLEEGVALVALVLVLMVRPTGLFGSRQVERV